MSVPKKILVPTVAALLTGVLVGAMLPLGITDPNPPLPPPGVGAVGLAQPGGEDGANLPCCGLSGASLGAANSSFGQALQDYRKGLGSAVTMDDNLSNLAKQDGQWVATTGPDSANTVVGGQTLMQRIQGCGLHTTTAASEIVLNGCFGSNTDGIMQNLQADPAAKAILDDPTWDSFGISVVSTQADGVYWLVIFAKEH